MLLIINMGFLCSNGGLIQVLEHNPDMHNLDWTQLQTQPKQPEQICNSPPPPKKKVLSTVIFIFGIVFIFRLFLIFEV